MVMQHNKSMNIDMSMDFQQHYGIDMTAKRKQMVMEVAEEAEAIKRSIEKLAALKALL